jgi:hypothetical protein
MVIVRFIVLLALCFCCNAAEPASVPLRGKLIQESGKPPSIETSPGKRVELSGDEPTLKVLNDDRLKNSDFEVEGHFSSPDHFDVDHIHTRSLFVYKDGKRQMVTYWCDVCYIRTYSPGKCWCCQKNTDLDPQDPEP